MKRNTKKMGLWGETVRMLTGLQLRNIGGGRQSDNTSGWPPCLSTDNPDACIPSQVFSCNHTETDCTITF